jgi:predicted nucleic acid-binding protein
METLVGPLKNGNKSLERDHEKALMGTDLRLLPITQPILRAAAELRATTKLKTPGVLHVVTAQTVGCVLFITNDVTLRAIPNLPLVILDDLLKP